MGGSRKKLIQIDVEYGCRRTKKMRCCIKEVSFYIDSKKKNKVKPYQVVLSYKIKKQKASTDGISFDSESKDVVVPFSNWAGFFFLIITERKNIKRETRET